RIGENIQVALENRAALGLSAAQVEELEAVRSRAEGDLLPMQRELEAVRAEFGAGTAAPGALDRLHTLLAELDEAAAPYRAAMVEILTPEQHRTLQRLMYDSLPYWDRGSARVGVGAAGVGAYRGPFVGRAGGRWAARWSGRGGGWGGRGFRGAWRGYWPR
ncbi:MAG: Spy/CpxP family protein refolding chaperone, partial [Gemmatimonadota bacterium]